MLKSPGAINPDTTLNGAKILTNDVLVIENEYLFEENSQLSISFRMYDLTERFEIMTLKQGSKTIAQLRSDSLENVDYEFVWN